MGGNPAVTSYIANTLNPGLSSLTAMNLAHIAYVDDLVRGASENGTRPVALVIESYGGEATFPLEIIHRAKTYCKEFYVIAINVAKSVATLLALLADRIVAVETASF